MSGRRHEDFFAEHSACNALRATKLCLLTEVAAPPLAAQHSPSKRVAGDRLQWHSLKPMLS